MSSIKKITSSNPVPPDLAQKLGEHGIGVILSTMWLGYHDMKKDPVVYATMDEDSITIDWYAKIFDRWTSENRAAQICIKLVPYNQYPDNTGKNARGKAPTIDFCFRSWEKRDEYFGAECKRLAVGQNRLMHEYVDNGVKRFTSGKYSSRCSVSAMIGYVQNGAIIDVVNALKPIMTEASLEENLVRVLSETDPEYKSVHIRTVGTKKITLYHLFFDFSIAS